MSKLSLVLELVLFLINVCTRSFRERKLQQASEQNDLDPKQRFNEMFKANETPSNRSLSPDDRVSDDTKPS